MNQEKNSVLLEIKELIKKFDKYYNSNEILWGSNILYTLKKIKTIANTREIIFLAEKLKVETSIDINKLNDINNQDAIEDNLDLNFESNEISKKIVIELLLIGKLYVQGYFNEVVNYCINYIDFFKNKKKLILDHLLAYCTKLLIMSYIKLGLLNTNKTTLFELFNLFTINNSENSLSLVCNFIIKMYLDSNNYEEASTFINNCNFPEHKSNYEDIKFLYYYSFIKSLEGNYNEACYKAKFALRKLSENNALKFRLKVLKLIILLELLIGNIPEKSLFREVFTKKYLNKYYFLTKFVALGEINKFKIFLKENFNYFNKSVYFPLIDKLNDVVLTNGIKKISYSYSRISFKDIKDKLNIDNDSDVESIIAKAARDKVINPIIDYNNKWVIIKPNLDYLNSTEPQENLKGKIDFCISFIENNQNNMAFKKRKVSLEKIEEDDNLENIDVVSDDEENDMI